MASKREIKTRVISKHDSEANWSLATNFIPFAGEIIIYDADENNPLPRVKIGDGKTTVSNLSFMHKDLKENLQETQENLANLIDCGSTDPDASTVSKFYFKYAE